MCRVHLHLAADRDLDEHARYYLERGAPETALRWYEQARATFEFLAGRPEIRAQMPRRQALRGIRSWPVSGFERYDVFYRPMGWGIEVVRVLLGMRELDATLDAMADRTSRPISARGSLRYPPWR
jgi:toxin ParE1/3/4